MKLFLYYAFSLAFIWSCQNSKEALNTAQAKTQIETQIEVQAEIETEARVSQAQLHEQTYGHLKIHTEQGWDSLNDISKQILYQLRIKTATKYFIIKLSMSNSHN